MFRIIAIAMLATMGALWAGVQTYAAIRDAGYTDAGVWIGLIIIAVGGIMAFANAVMSIRETVSREMAKELIKVLKAALAFTTEDSKRVTLEVRGTKPMTVRCKNQTQEFTGLVMSLS